jgi:agmatinase
MIEIIFDRTARTEIKFKISRIITLEEDHTTTLAALRSTKSRWGKVSIIHFDSHIG